MLVDSNHAKACFSSLRDRPAGVQNAFAFSDSQHLNVLLGPSGRPLCVQNAFAFCQPLGHLILGAGTVHNQPIKSNQDWCVPGSLRVYFLGFIAFVVGDRGAGTDKVAITKYMI